MKRFIFLLMLFIWAPMLFSQQDVQFTQYMYNTVGVNPGYTGSRGHMSMAAMHRSQWTGLSGAPITQTLNVHSPIGYKGVGAGFSIVNDQIGPTSETSFDLDFAYSIPTAGKGLLSFGLKGSINLLDIRFSELNQFTNDTSLESDINNRLSPNIGAGIYYHTNKFYIGLSVPRILETSHFEKSSRSTAQEQMNFYVITGFVFDLSPLLKFKPALLAKATNGAPLQIDLSTNFMLYERFVLGAAYRWDAAFSGMVGFQIMENVLLGLAYDRELTELGNGSFNDGSFEILFRYDLIKTTSGIKSPRFF